MQANTADSCRSATRNDSRRLPTTEREAPQGSFLPSERESSDVYNTLLREAAEGWAGSSKGEVEPPSRTAAGSSGTGRSSGRDGDGPPPAPDPSAHISFAASLHVKARELAPGLRPVPLSEFACGHCAGHVCSPSPPAAERPLPMNGGFALSGSGSIPPDAATAPPAATMPVIRPPASLEPPEGPP